MAYLLTGSEDGVIGLYGNKKRALAAAKDYVAKGNDIRDEEVYVDDHGFIIYLSSEDSTWATANIEKMEMQ